MISDSDGAGTWPELLARACASTQSVLARVSEEQFTHATPCAEWSVRDLVGHIVGATDFFADLAEFGDSPEDREWPEYADGEFLAAFGRHAARATAAFAAPGALDKLMALPSGPSPGAVAIQVATGEIFVHGWDLAAAAGRGEPTALDDTVADALLVSDWMVLCVQARASDPTVFAPEIEPPDGSSAADRLAAFLGRDPAWTPARALRARGLSVRRPARTGRVGRLNRRCDQLTDGPGERLVEFLSGWLCSRGHVASISAIPPWTCSDVA
jgi:uncharacterized protein (TIGR03086 family)